MVQSIVLSIFPSVLHEALVPLKKDSIVKEGRHYVYIQWGMVGSAYLGIAAMIAAILLSHSLLLFVGFLTTGFSLLTSHAIRVLAAKPRQGFIPSRIVITRPLPPPVVVRTQAVVTAPPPEHAGLIEELRGRVAQLSQENSELARLAGLPSQQAARELMSYQIYHQFFRRTAVKLAIAVSEAFVTLKSYIALHFQSPTSNELLFFKQLADTETRLIGDKIRALSSTQGDLSTDVLNLSVVIEKYLTQVRTALDGMAKEEMWGGWNAVEKSGSSTGSNA